MDPYLLDKHFCIKFFNLSFIVCGMERFHSLNMSSFEVAKSGQFHCHIAFSFQVFHILDRIEISYRKHRFMVVPDMLKNAPMFKRLDARIKVYYLPFDILSTVI